MFSFKFLATTISLCPAPIVQCPVTVLSAKSLFSVWMFQYTKTIIIMCDDVQFSVFECTKNNYRTDVIAVSDFEWITERTVANCVDIICAGLLKSRVWLFEIFNFQLWKTKWRNTCMLREIAFLSCFFSVHNLSGSRRIAPITSKSSNWALLGVWIIFWNFVFFFRLTCLTEIEKNQKFLLSL